MALPDFPDVTDEQLAAIARHLGLASKPAVRLPQVGIFNAIYALGDNAVLRIPRAHPRFEGTAGNEAVAVPLARAAGVRTPALLSSDASRQLVPFVYSVYERVDGVGLEGSVADPALAGPAWHELGRDLARLHTGVASTAPLIEWDQKTDPRPLPESLPEQAIFAATEADWLDRWLARLSPYADATVPSRFLHGDSQASNLIVAPDTLDYRAVLDWGSCLWGDIALDFAGVPLRAVPAMLAGYRELAATDDGLEPRIVWRHLQIALHQLRGQPVPEQSWAERPMGMLLEVLRFFAGKPSKVWAELGP